jgi:two-component sensor histidine kinase
MNRPWQIWLVFGLCLAVLLAAMGWVTSTAVRLDRAEWQASQRAELEERTRLALWRMDSLLAPLIIEESARPFNAYEAFPATTRAYTKSFTQIKQGDVLVPSPLLTIVSSNILLHFQLGPDGRVTSPQVPASNQRDLAESSYTTPERVKAAAARLVEFEKLLAQRPAIASTAGRSVRRDSITSSSAISPIAAEDNGAALRRQTAIGQTNALGFANAPGPAEVVEPALNQKSQMFRNSAEMQARANVYNLAQQQVAANNLNADLNPQQSPQPSPINEALFRPVWLGHSLVLARRVNLGGIDVIQGCWLNWPSLQQSLLGSIRDLFPDAQLEPVTNPNGERDGRMLAAVPAKLVPGATTFEPMPCWTPVRISLAIAWGCMLLAGLAVAGLLHGTISLSERRGAFVSAVTHELRTPLTTFKMYSEMLAAGMVPDAEKRTHYLNTLCSEANRLSHLVENVLAYARLERGSARSRVERLSLGQLVERVKPRLADRADRAGMTLETNGDEAALRTEVRVDVSAVEQILFNLVDNACKYAAPNAAEKIIHLEALPDGKFAMLRVRDHGQGISAEGAKRLFQPFSKSAHEAARTAPGVGLGLALCRRLSRSLGGDLWLDNLVKDGACFVLRLPISPPGGVTHQAASSS